MQTKQLCLVETSNQQGKTALNCGQFNCQVVAIAFSFSINFGYMETITGRKCWQVEKDLTIKWMMHNCLMMEVTIQERAWTARPKNLQLAIEQDVDELDRFNTKENDEAAAWLKYMKKWNRAYSRG